jgi:hypothetical protein
VGVSEREEEACMAVEEGVDVDGEAEVAQSVLVLIVVLSPRTTDRKLNTIRCSISPPTSLIR